MNDIATTTEAALATDAAPAPAAEAKSLPLQITIALPEPIEFNGKTVAELVIHEPRAFDLLKAEEHLKGGANFHALRMRQVHLIAHCARVPAELVLRVPGRCINEAWEYLQPFC